MMELIFPEYKKNNLFGWHMVYVIGDNQKYNNIWGRDFNIWLIMIKNNNFWMEAVRDVIELTMICVIVYIPHASYKE